MKVLLCCTVQLFVNKKLSVYIYKEFRFDSCENDLS